MDTTALAAQFQGDILNAALVARPEHAAPDSLDLGAMARHALNYLRGNPDPARGYECKFELGPLGLPCHLPQSVPPNAYGYDPISLGDTDCRMMLQYAHMRAMAGGDEAEAVEAGVRARVMGYLREDGLAWTNPASWTGDPIDGVWINKWTTVKILTLLADDYAATGDPAVRDLARRSFAALKALAAWDGPRAYYPGGGVPVKDGRYLTQGWCEEHSRNYPAIVEPCVHYAIACGDQEALDFAVAVTEGFLAGSQPGQGDFRIDPDSGVFAGHVHLHTHTTWGVAHLGALLDEPRYLDWAQNAYEFVRRHGTDYGWYPEFIPQPRHAAEVCVIGDMTSNAVWLAHRHPHYFDHVHRTVRNVLRCTQFFLTDAFLALFDRLHADLSAGQRQAALAELRKLEGGFISAPAPDDWVKHDHSLGAPGRSHNGIDMMGCCPPEGMRALWEAWAWTVREEPDGIRVNLALTRDHPAARVSAGAPEAGCFTVEARVARDFHLRPPAWASRVGVTLTRNGSSVPMQWGGPDQAYVVVPAVKVGESLRLQWDVPCFVQQQTMRSVPEQEYDLTLEWVGDEVEAVDPPGAHLPLFERL